MLQDLSLIIIYSLMSYPGHIFIICHINAWNDEYTDIIKNI